MFQFDTVILTVEFPAHLLVRMVFVSIKKIAYVIYKNQTCII